MKAVRLIQAADVIVYDDLGAQVSMDGYGVMVPEIGLGLLVRYASRLGTLVCFT